MENLIDFDLWLKEYVPQEIIYVAVFDGKTGAVKSVGPAHAFLTENNKIEIDKELAESIIQGTVNINSCFIDILNNSIEVKTSLDADDINLKVYKIPDIKYSNEFSDICLTYWSNDKILRFELSKDLGGTKITPRISVNSNCIAWDNDKVMTFFITTKNNPNLIYDVFEISIQDLCDSYIDKQVSVDSFSVYTERIFKNYSIEYK